MSSKLETLAHLPEHSSTSPLSVHAMTVAYDKRPVLWDVDYEAPAGALVAVVGPNGAGKSTFLKACLNLVPRISGIVEFWGKSYREVRLRVGYVPQRESVDWDFPVSALDVAAMGLYGSIGWFRRVKREHREKAREYLARVGMADFADRQISQLSGGQQQRVFLAHALAQNAELYLMDEPFAGVDAATEKAIVDVLKELKNKGATIVCVHHHLPTVSDYFDHAVLVNMRIVAAGTVKSVFTNENLQRTYGGKLTLLDQVSQALAERP